MLAATSAKRTYHARSRVSWLGKLTFWIIVFGLLGLNVWNYVRNDWPLPDLKTIEAMLQRKQFDEAEPSLREHVRRSPNYPEARVLLGRIYLEKYRDFLECARQLHKVPDWWLPRKTEALYSEGRCFMQVDRAKDAEAAWKACVRDDPLHPIPPAYMRYYRDANQELIELYAHQERWNEARAVIWSVYENAEPIDQPAVLVMRMRLELERIERAVAVVRLRRFVAADPTDWESRRALAVAEQAVGNAGEALRQNTLCVEARPDDPRARRDRIAILRAEGDDKWLDDAISATPGSTEDDADLWMYRGMALEKAGELEAAQKALRRSIELKPFEAEPYYRASLVEQRRGDLTSARRDRQRHKELRDATVELTRAYQAYVESLQSKEDGGPNGSPISRMAAACENLGWKREAAAWRLLASQRPGE